MADGPHEVAGGVMVYARKGTKRLYFEAATPTGYQQLATGTTNKILARQMHGMWQRLAEQERAWDVLTPVLSRTISLGQLWDAWQASGQHLAALRRLLADVDLSGLVDGWAQSYRQRVAADTVAHALQHVRWLLPVGTPCMASQVTPAWLTDRLAAYQTPCRMRDGSMQGVGRATRRKVHASWSAFFDDARVRAVVGPNPMHDVERPTAPRPLVRFLELPQVERLVNAADGALGVLFAISYGTAGDLTPVLALTRDEVDLTAQAMRIQGTKAHTRDRICYVADWAWPIITKHCRTLLPGARLFPTWHRKTVSEAHRQLLKTLGLPALPLRNARHHWAVRMLRAGAPIAVVQAQLGHGSPMLTLSTYGPFLPDASDRAHWEAQATNTDARRMAR